MSNPDYRYKTEGELRRIKEASSGHWMDQNVLSRWHHDDVVRDVEDEFRRRRVEAQRQQEEEDEERRRMAQQAKEDAQRAAREEDDRLEAESKQNLVTLLQTTLENEQCFINYSGDDSIGVTMPNGKSYDIVVTKR